MYIRRKVFSVIEDEYGQERLFSTTEFINEDTYLDYRLYADTEDALAGAGAAGLTAAAIGGAGYGAHKGIQAAGKSLEKRRNKRYNKLVEDKTKDITILNNARENINNAEDLLKKAEKSSGKNSESYKASKKLLKKFKDNYNAEKDRVIDQMVKNEKLEKNEAGMIEKLAKKTGVKTSKAAKLVRENKKIAAGIAAGTVAAGAGGNMLYNRNKNK